MHKMLLAIAAMTIMTTPAFAAPCRDGKGKFMKCAPKPMAKKAPCRDAKGHFMKCK